MKTKEYFFYEDWKTRKKKFLRVCNPCEFKIIKTNDKNIKNTERQK